MFDNAQTLSTSRGTASRTKNERATGLRLSHQRISQLLGVGSPDWIMMVDKGSTRLDRLRLALG